MSEIATIGLDIAKNLFQVHGVDRSGKIVLRKALRRSQVPGFFKTLSPLPDRIGGLRDRSSLGPHADGPRP
jgi:transposase